MDNPDYRPIGIDIGTDKIVVSAFTDFKIEIVCNELSYRETSNLVSFTNEERIFGDIAKMKYRKNMQTSIVGVNKLLDFSKKSNEIMKTEQEFNFSELKLDEYQRILVKMEFKNKAEYFFPESAMAFIFESILKILKEKNIIPSILSISVPDDSSFHYRKAILNSLEIAGVGSAISFIDESCAISIGYGIFRRNFFVENPKIILFVDIGHSKSTLSIVEFHESFARILKRKTINTFSCRIFNKRLLSFYEKKIKENFKIEVSKSAKLRFSIMEALNDQRIKLSANSENILSIDLPGSEYEFIYNMKRTEFEEMLKLDIELFRRHLKTIQEFCSKGNFSIDEIEALGGGSRTPFIPEIISEVFPSIKICKSLNAKECVATGCTIQAALKSGFKIFPYAIKQIISTSYIIETELSNPRNSGKQKTNEFFLIFSENEQTSECKMLVIREDWVFYDSLTINLFSIRNTQHKDLINIYKCKLPINKYEKIKRIEIEISLNEYGIIALQAFYKMDEGERQAIFLVDNKFSNLSEIEISNLQNLEEELEESDLRYCEIKDLENEIESNVFRITEQNQLNASQMDYLENLNSKGQTYRSLIDHIEDLKAKLSDIKDFEIKISKEKSFTPSKSIISTKVYSHPIDKLNDFYKMLYYKYKEIADLEDNSELMKACEEYKIEVLGQKMMDEESVAEIAKMFEAKCQNILNL